MKKVIIGFLLMFLCSGNVFAQADSATELAVAAAESWLLLVDNGRFEQSWDNAAKYFQQAITKEQWMRSVAAIRVPLGANVSRELVSAEYYNTLPGAPDGEYVMIKFKTSFEHKKQASETITPVLEPDGSWRASGYYIR